MYSNDKMTQQEPLDYIYTVFDKFEFERLDPETAACMEKPDPKYDKIIVLLQKLIKQDKLYMMDKDTGVPMPCSAMIGLDGKLLLVCER